ncbi:MAG: cyclodeaminase/cyclohydrolase family protein [Halanaerobiales bacterium]|nr:cyclodeaminase/cyclohydrolase family protein [Halanaerobiales bacterium]
MTFANMSLKEFNSKLASDSPTPGGGSVAGLSAALAASLASMVVNLTKDSDLDKYSDKLEENIDFALELIDKDALSFNKVMDAFKMKKETEKDKEERQKAIQTALYDASLTPMETIKLAKSILEITVEVAKKGNKNAVSDAGVAALMALASVKSAAYNVYINTASLKDRQKANELEEKAQNLVTESQKLADKVENICMEKI